MGQIGDEIILYRHDGEIDAAQEKKLAKLVGEHKPKKRQKVEEREVPIEQVIGGGVGAAALAGYVLTLRKKKES